MILLSRLCRAASGAKLRGTLLAAALVLSPLSAWGSDADTLFKEGREAATRGDYATACTKFTASYALDPAIGTSLNIGDCHDHLGHLVVAMSNYERAIARMSPGDPRNAIAKKQLAQLDKRVARVTFTMDASVPKGTRLRVDDVEIEPAKLGTPQPLDAGAHTVVVLAPGRRDRSQSLVLAEGQRKSVELAAGEEVPPEPAHAEPALGRGVSPVPEGPPAETGGSTQKTIGFVVGAVGIAGLATGSITGLMATSRASTFRSNCQGNVCNQAGVDAAHSGSTLVTITNVAFGVGIVALAAGIVLVLTSPSQPDKVGDLTPAAPPEKRGLRFMTTGTSVTLGGLF